MRCKCGLRNNPDDEIRNLERIVAQDPSARNYGLLNIAQIRAGLPTTPRVFKFAEGWQAQTALPDGTRISSATMSHDGWWGIGHICIGEKDVDLGHHFVRRYSTDDGLSPDPSTIPTQEEVIRAHQQVVIAIRTLGELIGRHPWVWPEQETTW